MRKPKGIVRMPYSVQKQTLTASYEKKECVRSFIITNNFVLNARFDYLFALNCAKDEAVSQVNKSIGFRLATIFFQAVGKKESELKVRRISL